MRSLVFAVNVLILAHSIVGCSERTPESSVPSATSPKSDDAVVKSRARTERIKSLEARVAESDADAQLALAKTLLDGNEASPDYERAKELLLGASAKGIPEAHLGLYLLRVRNVINDDRLPDASALRAQALATNDPFVTLFLYRPFFMDSSSPPELVVKLAGTGNPLANAKMAMYYGQMAFSADNCRKMAAAMKKLKVQPTASETERCSRVSQITDSPQRAIAFALEITDAKEVDADKMRYWTLLTYRLVASKNTASDAYSSPLERMQVEHVARKADPYSSVIGDALGQVGRIVNDGSGGLSNPAQAAQLLKRAAELGNSEAQNALGELYQSGRGVPKDFEMAARYFAQSALQGDAGGAKNIGLAFARGQGVEQNPVQAYFWLGISSLGASSQSMVHVDSRIREQIDDPAAIRDKLARTMSAQDTAAAQRLTRDWRPSYQIGSPPAIAAFAAASPSDSNNTAPVGGKLTKRGTGTVFVVSKLGHAVTNQHVIDGCIELRVEGREGLAKRVTEDVVNDLAIVQIPGAVSATAIIGSDSTKLRQGEDIVVFGFPLNTVLSSGGNLTPGVVSALTGLGNNTNQIQITAPIQPGSSGSPVINKKGEVVGVVAMKLSDRKMANATGSIGQNVNFAVSGRTLKAFLDTNTIEYRSNGLLSFEKSAADLADEARKWTLVLECMK